MQGGQVSRVDTTAPAPTTTAAAAAAAAAATTTPATTVPTESSARVDHGRHVESSVLVVGHILRHARFGEILKSIKASLTVADAMNLKPSP